MRAYSVKLTEAFPNIQKKSLARKFLVIALVILEYDGKNTAFHSGAWDMHVIRKFSPRLPAHRTCHTVLWEGFGSFITGSHCRVL